MSQINPFTGSIVQAPQVQRQQAADKDRHLRKANDVAKNSALADDRLEHQVESSDTVAPLHEDDQHPDQQKRKSKKRPASATTQDSDDQTPPHVDLTA